MSDTRERIHVFEIPGTGVLGGLRVFVYNRSWPNNASGTYSPCEIAGRLASRTLDYWVDLIERSTARLAGEVDGTY